MKLVEETTDSNNADKPVNGISLEQNGNQKAASEGSDLIEEDLVLALSEDEAGKDEPIDENVLRSLDDAHDEEEVEVNSEIKINGKSDQDSKKSEEKASEKSNELNTIVENCSTEKDQTGNNATEEKNDNCKEKVENSTDLEKVGNCGEEETVVNTPEEEKVENDGDEETVHKECSKKSEKNAEGAKETKDKVRKNSNSEEEEESQNLLVEDDRKFVEEEEEESRTVSSPQGNNLSSDENSCQSTLSETKSAVNADGEEESNSTKTEDNDIQLEESNDVQMEESNDVQEEESNDMQVEESNEEELKTVTSLDIDVEESNEEEPKIDTNLDIDVEDNNVAGVEETKEKEENLKKEDKIDEDVMVTEIKTLLTSNAQKRPAEDIEDDSQNKSFEPVAKKLKPSKLPEPSSKQLKNISDFKHILETKVIKKLNREQLEQILLQKMCEAIVDKSDLGALRHENKVLEQKVETWRNNSVQLAKQLRDLEVVVRKCMSDIKNGKEVIPLRNTRSVGLQVNTTQTPLRPKVDNVANQVPVKRRGNRVVQTSPVKTNVNGVVVNGLTNGPGNVNASKPQQTQATHPILTKALSDKTSNIAVASTPTKVMNIPVTHINGIATITPQSSVVSTNSTNNPNKAPGVIDLTDEEDIKTTASNAGPVTNAMLVTTPNSVGGQKYMYVIQQNQLQPAIIDANKPGQQKAIMVKLNSSVASTAVRQTINFVNAPISTNINTNTNTVRMSTPAVRQPRPTIVNNNNNTTASITRHPAPLPGLPNGQSKTGKPIPPRPILSIKKDAGGIILSWKMPTNLKQYESIASYQLFAYQVTDVKPSSDMWRKVGDVKALALPMACTLSQFADGNKYFFAVRAVDVRKRVGPFSSPEEIVS